MSTISYDPTRRRFKLKTWVDVADSISKMSTCKFTQVGCVLLTNDLRVISTGYNGVVSGSKHCNELEMTRDEHKTFAEFHEIHAEMNALIQSVDRSSDLGNSICVSTLQPCLNCVKHLYQSGVRTFVYKDEYWRTNQEEFKKSISGFFPEAKFITLSDLI